MDALGGEALNEAGDADAVLLGREALGGDGVMKTVRDDADPPDFAGDVYVGSDGAVDLMRAVTGEKARKEAGDDDCGTHGGGEAGRECGVVAVAGSDENVGTELCGRNERKKAALLIFFLDVAGKEEYDATVADADISRVGVEEIVSRRIVGRALLGVRLGEVATGRSEDFDIELRIEVDMVASVNLLVGSAIFEVLTETDVARLLSGVHVGRLGAQVPVAGVIEFFDRKAVDEPEQAAVVVEVRVADDDAIDGGDVVGLKKGEDLIACGVNVVDPAGRIGRRGIAGTGVVKVGVSCGCLEDKSETEAAGRVGDLKAGDSELAGGRGGGGCVCGKAEDWRESDEEKLGNAVSIHGNSGL